MMAMELVFDFEICDCEACPGSEQWLPRYECGCDEDICPECGCCSLHCEGLHDDDQDGMEDDFEGDAFEVWRGERQRQFECYGDYLPYKEK